MSGDGYAEFTVSTNTTARIASLSQGDSDQTWQDVDFGICASQRWDSFMFSRLEATEALSAPMLRAMCFGWRWRAE